MEKANDLLSNSIYNHANREYYRSWLRRRACVTNSGWLP